MNNSFDKKAGIALILFSILLVFTIVLHPMGGGGIQRLINMTGMIVVTHSVAILSLPFGFLGFWGLTRKLGTDHFWSVLAFGMASLGLVAALCAGATNGLVLPIFLQHYKEATPEALTAIDPILRYSFAINHAFDYIYTGAFCLAILCWSVAILTTRKLPVWMGWLGVVVSLATAVIFLFGIVTPVNVQGLRIFVASILIWILLVGRVLLVDLRRAEG
jgi:hypothetical protein